MNKFFYATLTSCLLLLALLSTEKNLLGMNYKNAPRPLNITLDGVPLNLPLRMQSPGTSPLNITLDGVPLNFTIQTQFPDLSSNSRANKTAKLRKAPLLGGNDTQIKKLFIASIGGLLTGFTCGIAESYLATDPTGIITEARNKFLSENIFDLTPQEVLQTLDFAEKTKRFIHIPITWGIATGARSGVVSKYSSDYQWLSFSTACVGYIAGLLAGKKLYCSGIEAEKAASFEIPGLVKVNFGGKISWK